MKVKNGRFLLRKLMMLNTYTQFIFISNKHIETVAKDKKKEHLNIAFYLDFLP